MIDWPAVWGVVFLIYVALGLWIFGGNQSGPPPEGLAPGSTLLADWKAEDSKGNRRVAVWAAGLALLCAAWWLTS